MTWGAVGGTALSIGAGMLGGKSKAPERAAKDAAARAQFAQEQARRQAQEALSPYAESGRGATRKLSELLGTAEPEGYARRPELQEFEDQLLNEHFNRPGRKKRGYDRNSNVAGQTIEARRRYDAAIKEWEAGKAKFEAENPGSRGDGRLLKDFTNEDFVQDPGYTFRLMEGEKGINRNLLARGGFDSGAALKELQRYTQDYASNEFGNAYNRDAANKGRTFNFLSGQAGQGLQASGMGVNANQNAANMNSQIQSNLGTSLSDIYGKRADNESNLFQNTVGNLVYAWERNKDKNRTPDYNPGYTGGSSSVPTQKFYL